MTIKISEGNSKIKNVANLSLPPVVTCVKNVPCATEGCYALGSWNRYPNVRAAWGTNLEFYKSDPKRFFSEFSQWIFKHQPERFRLFVGGDFPDEKFAKSYMSLCGLYPTTQFLVFTKRYSIDFSSKPDNCQVILSTWPGLTLPKNKDLPWAWLEGDIRIPADAYYLRCPGDCSSEVCGHKCWGFIDKDTAVCFPKH